MGLRVFVVVTCLVAMPMVALLGVDRGLEMFSSVRDKVSGRDDTQVLASTEPHLWRKKREVDPLPKVSQSVQKPPTVSPSGVTVQQNRHIGSEGTHFREIQARLQQLGAAYYRLETLPLVDSTEPVYVFYCSMTDPRLPRYQATANDPIEAMQQVLLEVEAGR